MIYKLLKIRPDETYKILNFTLFFVFIVIYRTIIQNITQAVFNIRVGVQYLPYMYFLIGILTLLLTIFLLNIFTKKNKKRVFFFFVIFYLLINLITYFLLILDTPFKILIAGIFIVNQLTAVSLSLIRWLILQDAVDIESLKRLFPIAGAGGTLGVIIGGLLLKLSYGIIHPYTLYLTSSICLFFILLFSNTILKKYKVIKKTSQNDSISEKTNFFTIINFLKNNNFYLYLLITGIIINILYYNNDYLFNYGAKQIYTNESQLSAFFGSFMFIESFISIFFEIFLVSRLIINFGSLRLMYFVLISSFLGILILFPGDTPLTLIASKAIFIIFVIVIVDSLYQLYYQPIESNKKDSLITVLQSTINLTGMIISGVIALFHSSGIINKITLLYINIFLLLVVFILWIIKNKTFLNVITRTLQLTPGIDIKKLFGENGINTFVPYFKKIVNKNSSSLNIVLEIITKFEFKDKRYFILEIFKSDNIEAQLEILENIQNNVLSYNLLFDLLPHVNENNSKYFMNSIFINYKNIVQNEKNIKNIEESNIKKYLGKDNYSLLMYQYMLKQDSIKYKNILNLLTQSKYNDDNYLSLKIMKNFINIEDTNNIKYITKLYDQFLFSAEFLTELIELMIVYKKDFNIFEKKVYTLFNVIIIKKIISLYNLNDLNTLLNDKKDVFSKICLLFFITNNKIKNNNEHLIISLDQFLNGLIVEKNKILSLDIELKEILVCEINHIKNTILSFYIEYYFSLYQIPFDEDIYTLLNDNYNLQLLIELIQDSLPIKISSKIINFIKEEITFVNIEYGYDKISVIKNDNLLGNIYKYLIFNRQNQTNGLIDYSNFKEGEFDMDKDTFDDINKLIILKSITMFKDLDINKLYQIMKISKYENIEPDEIIMNEGTKSDKFLVIINGKVGVYKNNKLYCYLENGEIIGELGIITDTNRTATIKSEEKTLLLSISAEDFINIMHKNGTIAFSIAKTVSSRLIKKMEDL